ncbi:MAG TPA: rhodanese-like domain-containing protein [Planctomycetota bacterium]|nr:rhodanese-like domain-containing protein [Planctomycetota bacterium]
MTTRTISGASTMQEVLEAFPAAQRALFRKYHIGGCSSCGFQPSDSLEQVLRSHDCQDPIESVVTFIQESQKIDDRTKVAPKTLKQWLDAKESLRLVDMRGPEETASGMIGGALQLSQDLVRQMHEEWPKSTKIVLYCQRGMRSADGAAYLAGHGFTNVWSLSGGIDQWANEVDPTVRRW